MAGFSSQGVTQLAYWHSGETMQEQPPTAIAKNLGDWSMPWAFRVQSVTTSRPFCFFWGTCLRNMGANSILQEALSSLRPVTGLRSAAREVHMHSQVCQVQFSEARLVFTAKQTTV